MLYRQQRESGLGQIRSVHALTGRRTRGCHWSDIPLLTCIILLVLVNLCNNTKERDEFSNPPRTLILKTVAIHLSVRGFGRPSQTR